MTCVVSEALMELTPFSRVLIFLHGVVICLRFRRVNLGHPALALVCSPWFGATFSFLQIRKSKVSLLLFKFLLNLDSVSVCRVE